MRSAMRSVLRRLTFVLACGVGALVASRPLAAQPPQRADLGRRQTGDTTDVSMVPAGFGSLRQDDLSIKVAPASGLQVRAMPLDERLIRLLSPDSYRAMRELVASKQSAVRAAQERLRLPSYSLWYVSFFALEQGETRFSPQELILTNTGRDFRPLEVIPLSAGFGQYRLRQREVQSALFLFDGAIDLNQPMAALMEGTPSATDWNRVLQLVERERTLVRSRAAAAPKP